MHVDRTGHVGLLWRLRQPKNHHSFMYHGFSNIKKQKKHETFNYYLLIQHIEKKTNFYIHQKYRGMPASQYFYTVNNSRAFLDTTHH